MNTDPYEAVLARFDPQIPAPVAKASTRQQMPLDRNLPAELAVELDRITADYPTGLLPWMWTARPDLTKAHDSAVLSLDAAVLGNDAAAFDRAVAGYQWVLKAGREGSSMTRRQALPEAPTKAPQPHPTPMPALPANTIMAVGLASHGVGNWVRVVATEPVTAVRRGEG